LSYSPPQPRLDSSRAWPFVWTPLFFECAMPHGITAVRPADLSALDPGQPRLYLLLKKIFWRRETSRLDLRHLAVNVLGFAPP